MNSVSKFPSLHNSKIKSSLQVYTYFSGILLLKLERKYVLVMFDIIKLIIILNYGSTSSTTFADRFMGYGAISDDIARFISEGYLSSKSIEIKSCRNDQNILASMENGFTPCQYIILNSGDIRSESDLLRLVLPFCEDEMKFKSQHLNPYGGGYGSVMECVRYTSHFFLTTVYEAYYSTKAKIEKFTPLVDIPLPTGCEWNWLWDLPNHEISNHSQVTILFRLSHDMFHLYFICFMFICSLFTLRRIIIFDLTTTPYTLHYTCTCYGSTDKMGSC